MFILLAGSSDHYLIGAILIGCVVLAIDELHNRMVFGSVGNGPIGEVSAAFESH